MPFNEKTLRTELKNINNNAFDVKEYFNLLHSQMLTDIPKSDLITAPNALVEEDSLTDFLNKDYTNQQYVLFFYAHKPHSEAVSPLFPEAPRSHTSLLLCKVTENKIERILNIDGYSNPEYVDITGERLGATPNPHIKDRLVIQAKEDAYSLAKSPLQSPSWYNLNCPIYALTFAKKILAIHAEQSQLLDNVFPEEKTLKPSKTALDALEKEILEGMVGTYVTKKNGNFISDKRARDTHHNTIRATLAQNYELQQRAMPLTSQSEPEQTLPEEFAPEQTETPVAAKVKSTSDIPHVPPGFGFFAPPPKSNYPEPASDSKSKLLPNESSAINNLIKKLNGEIHSKCWPYPNKVRKKIKVDALKSLLIMSATMELSDAIEAIEKEFKGVRDGHLSSRTSDLLDNLLRAHKPEYSPN